MLLRHGQSTANAARTFTGLLDVGLTDRGREQARAAAHLLTRDGLRPDVVLTSPMRRAVATTSLVVAAGGFDDVPVRSTWRLAERDYGSLTGVAKAEARELCGPELYLTVRRTLDGDPGPADEARRRTWPPAYTAPGSGLPRPGDGESLRDVVERVRPVWDEVRTSLHQGRTVLVVAHGNSLRALCLLIDDLTGPEVQDLNLPPAQPLRYDLTPEGRLTPRAGRYLDAPTARRAAAAIAAEGGT
ncbi:phosphoglycerate mutase [Cellulomonas bogoriensis 69B4 = DSM 16987]|uniref:2,3-bisphosphoglycerate-dependent phosphoglycerate mutase n=1 Tax=Cellulomonas bogoriensis 69B4 = DSM 16987 TaxID=1386082 RepID=A0A0A0BPU6_9CELL|nr:phosphoglycerate mutase [Cellulomonas bogoriensis 69B4 = DSM 16987]